jgi:hypothetical protein
MRLAFGTLGLWLGMNDNGGLGATAPKRLFPWKSSRLKLHPGQHRIQDLIGTCLPLSCFPIRSLIEHIKTHGRNIYSELGSE